MFPLQRYRSKSYSFSKQVILPVFWAQQTTKEINPYILTSFLNPYTMNNKKISLLNEAELETLAKKFAPAFYFHQYEQFFPCSIEYLLKGSALIQRESSDPIIIENPTQQDLADHSGTNFYVQITPSQYRGMYDPENKKVSAPLYYAVQQYENGVQITYPILYANQGGQACIGRLALDPFHCILKTYGEHQGDIERVSVNLVLNEAGDFYISEVGYETHGHMTWYRNGDFFHENNHPVVYVALNGHASYNGLYHPNDIYLDGFAAVVHIIDAIDNNGCQWRPWQESEFKLVGLNADGEPVNEQVWAKFEGRLGDTVTNSLKGGTYFDGSNLSDLDLAYVVAITALADLIGKLPDDIRSGAGPRGLAGREYIRPGDPTRRLPVNPITDDRQPFLFGLKNTTFSGEGWLTRIAPNGEGWSDVYKGKWSANYVANAITTFELNGHPYIFALKNNSTAYISRINDDGRGWIDVHEGNWNSDYIAVKAFELNGHPYLFSLKHQSFGKGEGWISRINDDGKGWTDIFHAKWSDNYNGANISIFMLDNHPYIFALNNDDRAFISRINDDGKGWTDIYEGKWDSSYITVKSFQLNQKPYLFSLKKQAFGSGEGWLTRINDDGKGWKDVFDAKWNDNYNGSNITTFTSNNRPYVFALNNSNTAYISRIKDDGNGWEDVYEGSWDSSYVAIVSYYFNLNLMPLQQLEDTKKESEMSTS